MTRLLNKAKIHTLSKNRRTFPKAILISEKLIYLRLEKLISKVKLLCRLSFDKYFLV